MQITRLNAWQPPTPGSPADWRTQLGQIVVQLETDQGLVGYGVGGGGRAGIHIVETVLRDLLVGRRLEDPRELHAEMLRHTAFYGRKGVVVMAISGVDLALWDVHARALKQPVAQLLNPRVTLPCSFPTYRTVFDEREAEAAVQQGVKAIKLHVERFGSSPDVKQLAALVAETRQRLGDRAEIMVDAFGRWDVPTTLRVADALAPFQIGWIEEPLQPDQLAGYAELAARSPVPIAGGEHEYTREGFELLVSGGLHAVLQPDINWCGGLSTLLEVYELAAAAGLRVCPHRGSEPFSLHAIAAVDPCPLAESPRAWFQLEGQPVIRGGRVTLAPCIGFGVNANSSAAD